jgi:hypothetical protein
MALTNYLENALLNATVRNTTYTSPATVYLALYSVAPTASTSGTELSGSGYSRQAITFNAPSGGAVTSNVTVTFGPATSNWSTIKATAVVDASTSGNIMYFTTTAAQNILSGSSLVIGGGNVSITLT